MKRNSLIIILILTVALLLSGCGKQDKAAEQATEAPTQPMPMESTQVPVPEFNMELPEGYDPASEEDRLYNRRRALRRCHTQAQAPYP